jgi:hypothetical protein
MLVSARILPVKLLPVPSVAELPTCQNTLQPCAPLIRFTTEPLAVVNALPVWKTKPALGLPCASSVTVPVSPAAAAKQ